MRMLLNDKYETINNHMSDSNVGGRRGRGIRDHLFIVNEVIHNHHNSNDSVSIQFFDFHSCFDSMWQKENINDLYESGIQDDKFPLLYKINEINEIAIQTAMGLSNVKTVKNIVCQGDPWGSIECSCIVDTFGKESLRPEMEPCIYKGKVPIPLLGMVDDMLCISKSGDQTQQMNTFVNVKSVTKRLQLNSEKCHVMHVRKHIEKMDLFVDGWKLQEVKNIKTEQIETSKKNYGGQDMNETENEKYLE